MAAVGGVLQARALLFDFDGTLVDGFRPIMAGLNAAFAHFGMPPWSEAQTRQRVGRPLTQTFPEMFGERWLEARACFYAPHDAVYLDDTQALPGCAEFLAEAFTAGIPMGIVTNRRGDRTRPLIEALGWGRYFPVVLGVGDGLEGKPDPTLLRVAVAWLGTRPGQAVYLGDSPLDMTTALAAGLAGVGVAPLRQHPEQAMREAGALRCFDNWQALRSSGLVLARDP